MTLKKIVFPRVCIMFDTFFDSRFSNACKYVLAVLKEYYTFTQVCSCARFLIRTHVYDD